MTETPHALEPWSEAVDTALVPAKPLPGGPRVGIWLLWLCFGLPASALAFLLLPGYLAIHAVELLEQAGIPLEAWTELEPWLGLTLLAACVNHRASFRHRRALLAADSRRKLGYAWLGTGALLGLGWVGLLGLENVPETTILPQLHYLALSGAMVWTGLSLAWLSGRVVSLVLFVAERRALDSAQLRGGLSTAGPLSAVALVAIVGSSVGLDRVDGTRAMQTVVADTFKNERSLVRELLSGAGSSSSGSSSVAPPSKPKRRPELLAGCIEDLFAGGKRSIYWQGVRKISGFDRLDPESIASDTALKVCSRPKRPEELRSYFLESVYKNALTENTREKKFGACNIYLDDGHRVPDLEILESCLYEQLCRLPDADHNALVSVLRGETAKEFAARGGAVSTGAAKKKRQRAKKRYFERVSQECME